MFTGLVERTGRIVERHSSGYAGTLVVEMASPFDGTLVRGESIAVNGCCLSLESESSGGKRLAFHTLAETLSKTNLGVLPCGSEVNLERALSPESRMGGHFVTGHIDGTSKILSFRKRQAGDWELTLALDGKFARWIVEKGSIAVDGISLTVERLGRRDFTVALIPLTLEDTALASRAANGTPDKPVNLEFDILGKYVARQTDPALKDAASDAVEGSVTDQKLADAGFFD